MEQGRIILDKVKPFMRRHAPKADSGVGFVLRNLHAQERGPIHAAKSLEHPVLITYSNTHRLPPFFLSFDCLVRRVRLDELSRAMVTRKHSAGGIPCKDFPSR